MTVSTFKVPDVQNQTVNAYNGTIAADFAVLARLGALFAPHAQEPANMAVAVDAGHFVTASVLTEVATQISATLPAPTSQDRIDRIVANKSTGIITVVSGAENATPTAPAIPQNSVPIARVLLQPGMTAITNDRITDERDLAGLGRPSAEGGLLNIQTFKQNGTYTPTSGTTRIVVEVQGGGGSGGGCGATTSSQAAAASGGAAGSYAKSMYTSGFSGGVNITVGLGGGAPNAGANPGNAGQTSSFGALISCPGGQPGNAGVAWPSPLVVGGSATATAPTGATIVGCPGDAGGHGIYLNLNNVIGGTGGGSFFGGGGNAGGGSVGANAPAFGAGGGGSSSIPNSSARSGGAGAAGIVIVHEYS